MSDDQLPNDEEKTEPEIETEDNSADAQSEPEIETEDNNADAQSEPEIETEDNNADAQNEPEIETEDNNADAQNEPETETEPDKVSEEDKDAPESENEVDESLAHFADSSPIDLVASQKEKQEDEEDTETFATSDAPWVGAENKWRGHPDEEPVEKKQPVRQSEPRDIPRDSSPMLTIRESSTPPPPPGVGAFGPESLPALASQAPPPADRAPEARLGIIATILAIVILIAVGLWWFLDFKAESDKSRQIAKSQQETIMKLQQQISALASSTSNESQEKAIELKAELEALQTKPTTNKVASPVNTAAKPDDISKEASEKQAPKQGTSPLVNNSTGMDKPAAENDTSLTAPKPEAPQAVDPLDDISDNPYSGITGNSQNQPGEKAPPPKQTFKVVKKEDDIGDLIESAIPKDLQAKSPAKTAQSQPQQKPASSNGTANVPSRQHVKAAMDAVAASVKKCGNGQGGKIKIKIAVSGATGRVMNAHPLDQKHQGTPVGICAARAVRMARFPKFNQNILVIKYPFNL